MDEKQLKELQAERQAAFDKAVEEAILLAQLDLAEREAAGPAVSEEPLHAATDGDPQMLWVNGSPKSAPLLSAAMDGDPQILWVNGFAFSTGEIAHRVHRELRLLKARQLPKTAQHPFQLPKAA